ncbi:hypothetical protein [Streptosporangium sp. NPDC051022]|uniref:hypothetical protein n=1 Tax=Streptosporangium sp. NPDC051022 TaxID=3155752 RepID=UPI003439EA90
MVSVRIVAPERPADPTDAFTIAGFPGELPDEIHAVSSAEDQVMKDQGSVTAAWKRYEAI